MTKKIVALFFLSVSIVLSEPPAGSIENIIGTVEVNPVKKAGWKGARPAMKIFSGDSLRTAEESYGEIRWSNNGVVRLAEKTSIFIEKPPLADNPPTAARVLQGRVWANMKAITATGKKFDLATPAAVAGIRGTVFRVNVDADSSTDVLVYEGKVAVGPNGILEKTPGDTSLGRHEVEGPGEVEGPQEVTLEDWVTIVAGQQIHVERAGAFKTWQFDPKQDSLDAWVKYNQERDKKIETK